MIKNDLNKKALKLKKSFYNIVVRELENKDILLYNSLSGAFGIMNDKGRHIYENIENIKELNTEDEINILNCMKSNGFLVEQDIDERLLIKTLKNFQRFSSETLGLAIVPTLDCNMACPYCYEKKGDIYMTIRVADDIIKFIEEYLCSNTIDNIHISWYGGEPLLSIDIISYILNKIIDLCKKFKKSYNASIVTNGTLLDRETAKILYDLKITRAQVTLDGTKEVNNNRRRLKNGSDSFEIITSNIINCADIIPITVRCNIDKNNITGMDELYNFFFRNDINFYIAPIEKQTDACSVNTDKCFSYKDFSTIEFDVLRQMYTNNKNIDNISYPSVKFLPCSALSSKSYVIDPYGNLYKCWCEIGDKNKAVGTIKDGIELKGNLIKWLSIEHDKKCNQCKLFPICLGGCHLKAIEGKELECPYDVINFRDKLELYYEDYANKNRINDKINTI